MFNIFFEKTKITSFAHNGFILFDSLHFKIKEKKAPLLNVSSYPSTCLTGSPGLGNIKLLSNIFEKESRDVPCVKQDTLLKSSPPICFFFNISFICFSFIFSFFIFLYSFICISFFCIFHFIITLY